MATMATTDVEDKRNVKRVHTSTFETAAPAQTKDKYADKPNRRSGRATLVPRSWTRKATRTTSMIESFFHAFNGLVVAFKRERNVRIHFAIAFLVVGLGIWLKIDPQSWIALTLSMGLVIATELVNTSLEHLVDISADEQYHSAARRAKDTAAAAVLMTALAAVVVGSFIFVPPLMVVFGIK